MSHTHIRSALLCAALMVLAAAVSGADGMPYTSDAYFAATKQDPKTFWKVDTPTPETYVSTSDLPDTFSWAKLGPDGRSGVLPVNNQHVPVYCGSCWAHGPAFALGSRLWIQNNFTGEPIMPSNQWVIDQNVCGSCSGGYPGCVYQLAAREGIPLDTCNPYMAINNAFDKDCFTCTPDRCAELEEYDRLYVREYGRIAGVQAMKKEIYARGPISCGMAVTQAFLNYDGTGVISGPIVPPPIDHIISVIGWGVLDHTEYWVVRNSWGVNWGDQGYALVDIHHDFRISSDCQWGVPELRPNTRD